MLFSAESYNGHTKKQVIANGPKFSKRREAPGFMIYTVLILMSLSNKNTLIMSEKYQYKYKLTDFLWTPSPARKIPQL